MFGMVTIALLASPLMVTPMPMPIIDTVRFWPMSIVGSIWPFMRSVDCASPHSNLEHTRYAHAAQIGGSSSRAPCVGARDAHVQVLRLTYKLFFTCTLCGACGASTLTVLEHF